MSEFARNRPVNTENPILNPLLYWRVSAFALAAIAVLGFLVNAIFGNNVGIEGFLKFDWAHNVLHLVLAVAAFIFGFANIPGPVIKVAAIIFGFVYVGLTLVGFIFGFLTLELFDLLSMELGEHLVHALLGAWALTAGFAAKY